MELDVSEERGLSDLMERLRHKCVQQRPWTDTVKALRSALTQDKRHLPDALDRVLLQRCMDTIHSAIKVLDQQSMVARLGSIARQTGLNFVESSGNNVFLSLVDMFYVEVCLDPEKTVRDVRVAHQGEPGEATSCEELHHLLSDGNFKEFTAHLEGLSNNYQVNGDKKQKTKAFLSLQSLETDLNLLAQLQNSINGVANYIHKSPLGILIPRKLGLPMKLIYFVSPYDLLDKKTKTAHPMTVEAIMEHELGHSVTVCLENDSPTKLQTMPLMTVNTHQEGKNLPSFSALSTVNSCTLPACFVLRLPKPIPLAMSIIKKIHNLTNIDPSRNLETKPLLSLIVEDESDGKVTSEKELYVTLPDQQHLYFLRGGREEEEVDREGVLVSRIPFTHPTHVPQILVHLRQQLLFNKVIGSCVRPFANKAADVSEHMVFEVTALSLQHLCVTFEHPLQESMATVEMDLSDITSVKCRICSIGEEEPFVTDDYATKVFQRCVSIPVTARAILRKVSSRLEKMVADDAALNAALREKKRRSHNLPPLGIPRPYGPHFRSGDFYARTGMHPALQHQNSAPLPQGYHQHGSHDYEHSALLDPASASSELLESIKAEKVAKNPMLASLLDQEPPGGAGATENDSPMLSKLLDDKLPTVTSLPTLSPVKPKKVRKRKSETLGPSPKHRPSEDGMSDRSDLETPSPLEMRLQSTVLPPLGTTSGPTLSQVIDLTEAEQSFEESHVSKLAHTVDNIIKNESVHMLNAGLPSTSEDVSSILNDIDYDIETASIKTESSTDCHPIRNPSLSSLLSDTSEQAGGMIDPDLFTNKGNSVSSAGHKWKRSISRQSSSSQQSEMLEFDTELLNSDPNFADSLIDNGEEMDLETCDATAFGVGINPVTEMASKLASSSTVMKSATAPKPSKKEPGSNSSQGFSDSHRTSTKRKLNDSHETENPVSGRKKSDCEPPNSTWKRPPEGDALNFCRKKSTDGSDTASGFSSRKKSESDVQSIYKIKTEADSSFVFRKKSEYECSSSVYRKKSELVDTAGACKKKPDNDNLNVYKKKPEVETSTSPGLRKKPEGDSAINVCRKKSESDGSAACKKSSEDGNCGEAEGCSPSSKNCNTTWLKSEEGPGIKMKISRPIDRKTVSSPLQVLDLSKGGRGSSKNSKDSSSDNGRSSSSMSAPLASYSVSSSASVSVSKSSVSLNSTLSPSKKLSSSSHSEKSKVSHEHHSSSSSGTNSKSSSRTESKSKRSKHSSSSDSAKRKREKDEYKREKKKKKLEDIGYQPCVKDDDTIYKSTTVDYPGLSDSKQIMPKLKITKSSRATVHLQSSTVKDSSSVMTVAPPKKTLPAFPIDDAYSFSRSEVLEKEELHRQLVESGGEVQSGSSAKSANSLHRSSSQKSSSSSHKSSSQKTPSTSKSITVSKADSKLMTKTPTIKLKPIVIPTTTASITVGMPTLKPPGGLNVLASPQHTSSTPTAIAVNKNFATSPYMSPTQSSSSRSNTPTTPLTPSAMASVATSVSSVPAVKSVLSSAGATTSTMLGGSAASLAAASGANKIKSPVRLRKGSLSAVIDKLTKSSNVVSSNVKPDTGEESSWITVAASMVAEVVEGHIKTTAPPASPVQETKAASGSSDKISSEEQPKALTNSDVVKHSVDSPRKHRPESGSSQRPRVDNKAVSSNKELSSSDRNTPKKSSSNSVDRDKLKHSSSSKATKEESRRSIESSSSKSGHNMSLHSRKDKSSDIGEKTTFSSSKQHKVVEWQHKNRTPTKLLAVGDVAGKNSPAKSSPVKNSSAKNSPVSSGRIGNSASSRSSEGRNASEVPLKYKEHNQKDSKPVDALNVKGESSRNVERISRTPASPMEEREHRSAEETAKIPVLERLQLEYKQDSSNCPGHEPGKEESFVLDHGETDPARELADTTALVNEVSQLGRSSTEKNNSEQQQQQQQVNRSRLVSPVSSVKFNGESEIPVFPSANQDIEKRTELPFRAPSKLGRSSPHESMGLDLSSPKGRKAGTNVNMNITPSSNCNSRSVPSPRSDASSPENDELVIDFPSTPKSNPRTIASSSPQPRCESGVVVSSHPINSERKILGLHSPAPKASPVGSPKSIKHSPALSPMSRVQSNPGSSSCPSPAIEIDDDLMDDVVLGMGS